MKKIEKTKESVFLWIIGITICSIASLAFLGFLIIIRVILGVAIGEIDMPLWKAFGELRKLREMSLLFWLFASQVILISLMLTAVASKINEFLLKKSKWYQWLWYS